ncbi:MAG: L-threonylcarbamoyladenylate synthase [Corynebacterium sp.]|nr:L-threonylcarbamoyladenylate synthase [Corynebacterium sp.]
MSRIFDCSDPESRELGLQTAQNAVAGGRLIVMPTDTVYGIGCDAFNNDAVARLLAAKHRGPDMPVAVLVGSWDTITGLVAEYPAAARTLVEAFWPGALSLIIRQAPSLPWNLGDTRGTVMLRMPLHPVAIELLRKTGPMAVSSANISGMPSATTAQAAESMLGDTVNCYLDAGESTIGVPSTIVDLSGDFPKILREGSITAEQIAEALGCTPESLR